MSGPVKPCPFCGGEAQLDTVKLPLNYDCEEIFVRCGDCDTTGSIFLFDLDMHSGDDIPDLEAEAITAWNTRTPSQQEAIAELVGCLAQYRDDLRHLPAPDSIERRLAMVNALIAKHGGGV